MSFDLRALPFKPDSNPFVAGSEIKTKYKTVRTRSAPRDMMDPETGEIVGSAIIHTIEEADEAHFVKVFADGVKAAFDLSHTGARVFQAVLMEYQKAKMTGGFSDSVRLYWFGVGLDGREIGMSKFTFNRGLKELLEKRFMFPRSPNEYWINPALFFKGDRVAFLREYRIGSKSVEHTETGAIERRATP
jgi:hypothetical protein